MNCIEFENHINAPADDRAAGNGAPEQAMEHARHCEACARRLTDQRTLTASLRAFAASGAHEQASAGVRQTLMTAFQQHHQERPAPVISRTSFSFRWLPAVAAILAIVAVVLAFWIIRRQPHNQSANREVGMTPSSSSGVDSSPKGSEGSRQPEQVSPDVAGPAEKRISNRTSRSRRSARQGREENDEPMAKFIPLTYSTDAGTTRESFVVRVKVARSTLLAMGVPIATERGGELLRADVMVSTEGVPLAIRLVR